MDLSVLNEPQLLAVTTTEGAVRVIAGAGSGKTRALSYRFAFLVNELGILPGNILCVTFTNKSAAEMRQRIHSLTGDNDTGYINTFHGFCVSVLQEDSYAIQYPKSFLVLDNADIDSMLDRIYEERNLTLRDMTYQNARDMIEIRKIETETDYLKYMLQMTLDELKDKYMQAQKTDDQIFYGYLYQEKKCFGVDYNDLIRFTLHIFKEREEIRRKWQQRLEYIMVDEFQDIDALQYELMEVLCGFHKNIFVVGDPDQTIYTWRGADIGFLLDFDKKFKDTKTILLNDNYRSTPQILAAANSLVSANEYRIKKELSAVRADGEAVICHMAKTQEEESVWIAQQIADLHEKGTAFRDITVLYRAHYVTRSVEQALLALKIPYTIYSGIQFFARMEIKDALSYLRMIAYKDDLSFRRIINMPRRNMGKRRMAFLEDYQQDHGGTLYEALCDTIDDPLFRGTKAQEFISLIESYASGYEHRPVSEVLQMILADSGYERRLRTEGAQERLDNLAELKQAVYDFETTSGEEVTLEHYLSHVALFTNMDEPETGDKVKLMTVHAAKGLEFHNVFLCGMNEGIFPSRKIRDQKGMEEERRLAFVALTRAMDRLYLTESAGRNFDGSFRYPSRFLFDIGQDLISFTEKPDESLIRAVHAYVGATADEMRMKNEDAGYKKGDRIVHKVFGKGTILDVDTKECASLIAFDSMDTPRKISFRVRLERVTETGEVE